MTIYSVPWLLTIAVCFAYEAIQQRLDNYNLWVEYSNDIYDSLNTVDYLVLGAWRVQFNNFKSMSWDDYAHLLFTENRTVIESVCILQNVGPPRIKNRYSTTMDGGYVAANGALSHTHVHGFDSRIDFSLSQLSLKSIGLIITRLVREDGLYIGWPPHIIV